jgi:two-component system sensor histidine kinase NreB
VNPGYYTKEFWKNIWKTTEAGNVWRKEIRNKTKDDSYYWVETTIVPFINKNNRSFQYLSIRQNITMKKNLEQKTVNSIIYSQEEDRKYEKPCYGFDAKDNDAIWRNSVN